MAAVCYLGFSKTWFWAIGRLGLCFSITVPNLVQKCCSTPNYGPKSKSKMAAIGFVTSSYRTTHEVFSLGYIGLSNFMLIRCIVLKIWRFEIFADFAWNAYSHPQNFGFLGVRTPKRHWWSSRPQKAHLWPKSHLHANYGADRSTGVTWARAEGIKKRRGKKLTVANWVFAQTTHVDSAILYLTFLHAGWSSGGSSKFQVSSKSDKPFSRCGGESKFAISYT